MARPKKIRWEIITTHHNGKKTTVVRLKSRFEFPDLSDHYTRDDVLSVYAKTNDNGFVGIRDYGAGPVPDFYPPDSWGENPKSKPVICDQNITFNFWDILRRATLAWMEDTQTSRRALAPRICVSRTAIARFLTGQNYALSRYTTNILCAILIQAGYISIRTIETPTKTPAQNTPA